MKRVTEFLENKAKIELILSEFNDKVVHEMFEEMFKRHEGLNAIVIRGITPGFNDGEPCEHSQESFVGSKHTSSYDNSVSFDFEDYGDEDLEEAFNYNKDKKTCSNDGCKTLKELGKELELLEDIFSKVYNTDFQLTVKKSGDIITVQNDHYDCGY